MTTEENASLAKGWFENTSVSNYSDNQVSEPLIGKKDYWGDTWGSPPTRQHSSYVDVGADEY